VFSGFQEVLVPAVVKGQCVDHGYHAFLLLYRVVISWSSFDEEFCGVGELFKNSNKTSSITRRRQKAEGDSRVIRDPYSLHISINVTFLCFYDGKCIP
jgi:hypothetical protein